MLEKGLAVRYDHIHVLVTTHTHTHTHAYITHIHDTYTLQLKICTDTLFTGPIQRIFKKLFKKNVTDTDLFPLESN